MSWQMRMVDATADEPAPQTTGDTWYVPAKFIKKGKDGGLFVWGYRLSDEYMATYHGKRPPLMVRLPDGMRFCIDAAVSGDTHGWTVTGEAPNVTVSPSINIVGSYHGWIQNGVISDDCEGRKFE